MPLVDRGLIMYIVLHKETHFLLLGNKNLHTTL